jgi:hypothetical protein
MPLCLCACEKRRFRDACETGWGEALSPFLLSIALPIPSLDGNANSLSILPFDRITNSFRGEEPEEGQHGEGGGAGGEKLKDKRHEETKYKEKVFQGKGKGEAVEKRKCPLSERSSTVGAGGENGKEKKESLRKKANEKVAASFI